jgi:hypothetical protein
MRFILMTLILVSCGDSSMFLANSRYKFKVADLIAKMGEPKTIEINSLDSSYKMYVYEKNITYQVADEIVIAHYRNPSQAESTIQYWRHKLEDCHYKIEAITASEGHTSQYKLICSAQGQTIFYQQNGNVLRIAQSMKDQDE